MNEIESLNLDDVSVALLEQRLELAGTGACPTNNPCPDNLCAYLVCAEHQSCTCDGTYNPDWF